MYFLFAANTFLGAMAEPIQDPANHPVGFAGYLISVVAILKFLQATYPGILPKFIHTALSWLPGWVPKDTLETLVTKLVQQLIDNGMSKEEAVREGERVLNNATQPRMRQLVVTLKKQYGIAGPQPTPPAEEAA